MSLATRCPACKTVFRVVQDQLRVSEGWVRCGRCSEVFNAVEQLVELNAPAILPDVFNRSPAAPSLSSASSAPHQETARSPALGPAVDIDIELDRSTPSNPLVRPTTPAASEEAAVDLPIAIDEDARRDAAARSPEASPAAATAPSPTAGRDEVALGAARPAPSFLRDSAAEGAWSRPPVRRSLALAAVALLALLALQVVVEYRNPVAARWPAAAPALHAICAWSGCRIDPPRWIEAIVVDSSGLVRVDGTQTYRFSVVLRNRSAVALSVPAVDLTLTDTRGQVIARRVLQAGDLGVDAGAVAPMAEVPMQATLAIAAAGNSVVSGYTIELFYP